MGRRKGIRDPDSDASWDDERDEKTEVIPLFLSPKMIQDLLTTRRHWLSTVEEIREQIERMGRMGKLKDKYITSDYEEL
tara:strand:- start:180 stop:416 length:237 start_codon:yes stop_codon:yes gene_type:complete